jgi:hypothetical protein
VRHEAHPVALAAAAFVGLPPACKKSDSDHAEPVAKTTPAKPELAAFKAPLTVATVMTANDPVELLAPWDDALASLQAHFGPPTKVDGKKFEWAAMEGDDCAYFYVEQDDGARYQKSGKVVGTVSHPMKVGKDGPIMNRGDCLDLVGKGVPPEDPNAPGPSGDKVSIGEIASHAVAARSKWDGKQLQITGKVIQGGTSAVLADEHDSKTTLWAHMKSGELGFDDMKKPIALSCTVKLEKVVSGAGQPGLDVSLADCTKI